MLAFEIIGVAFVTLFFAALVTQRAHDPGR